MHTPGKVAFTLIELLVVVAVIAILAAIALPNFLEAQTRAKVSRAKADQRTIATAAETYRVDWNHYPVTSSGSLDERATDPKYENVKAYKVLSSPVAYMTNARLRDAFAAPLVDGDQVSLDSQHYQFASGNAYTPLMPATLLSENFDNSRAYPRDVYAVVSFGPNGKDETMIAAYPFTEGIPYDPTNGTVSDGDIFRCGPGDAIPWGWRGGPLTQPF